ncbi:FAD:protein FMN transferase [Clostridium rectalis]|uniref:FAD:protein FMN transferase n=1 Tax=Clostridium rectalis TaxID=2040295 RepID=UPI000F62E249|nr:FAD:protein FMN transferase [Clostridium rectalis]
MKKKFVCFLVVILIFSLLLSSCKTKEEPVISKENYLLGTIVQLKVYGKNAESASNKAMDIISDIDNKMSPSKANSEISNINKNAGKSFVKVSDDTFIVIKKALEYSKLSSGYFDITIGPLVNLWGIGTDKAIVPSVNEINKKKSFINYNDIILDDKSKSVKLKKVNESIDLGGIAKGYTADKVKECLLKEGIKTAFINLGGNIVTVGNKSDNSLWSIGIQDPLKTRGEYFSVVKVSEKSIVSSGNYERFFIKDGKKYHHILDPKTGYPSENGLIATTIISDKSIDGDAISTSTYILGLEKGLKLVESLEGVEAIFVTSDKKVYITSGLKDSFNLTNKEYTYEER